MNSEDISYINSDLILCFTVEIQHKGRFLNVFFPGKYCSNAVRVSL